MNKLRFLPVVLLLVCCRGEAIAADSARQQIEKAAEDDTRASAAYQALLLKAMGEADQIPDLRSRAAAQWRLVQPLVERQLSDLAFQQAMKLKTSNPQTCIYSLTAIGKQALKRGASEEVEKVFRAGVAANVAGGRRHDHYAIEMAFKLNRPLQDAIAIAAAAKSEGKQRAYCDIRNELAARGRVDEAYTIAKTYLTAIPQINHDREIAYQCAAASQLTDQAPPDHFEQAIHIIERMPAGEYRDFVIGSLIENLLIKEPNNKAPVPEERMALAERWMGELQNEVQRAAARRSILRHRLSGLGVAELEQQFARDASREEQIELLNWIFRALLDKGRLAEADAILPRQLKVIRDQPRPETRSQFGSFNDNDAIRVATWIHEQAMVQALVKADRKDDARLRIEAMKDLPEAPPLLFVGNLESIRLSLYLELGDDDAAEKLIAERTDPEGRAAGMVNLAVRFVNKGELKRGLQCAQVALSRPAEELFPASNPALYFLAEPYGKLAATLFKAGRTDEAMRVLNKIPEHEQSASAFESFGEALVQADRMQELDDWLEQLPHHTARTSTCLGAIQELSKARQKEQADSQR
jgi:tetratricopeptide (TPR) repeat protein